MLRAFAEPRDAYDPVAELQRVEQVGDGRDERHDALRAVGEDNPAIEGVGTVEEGGRHGEWFGEFR